MLPNELALVIAIVLLGIAVGIVASLAVGFTLAWLLDRSWALFTLIQAMRSVAKELDYTYSVAEYPRLVWLLFPPIFIRDVNVYDIGDSHTFETPDTPFFKGKLVRKHERV